MAAQFHLGNAVSCFMWQCVRLRERILRTSAGSDALTLQLYTTTKSFVLKATISLVAGFSRVVWTKLPPITSTLIDLRALRQVVPSTNCHCVGFAPHFGSIIHNKEGTFKGSMRPNSYLCTNRIPSKCNS